MTTQAGKAYVGVEFAPGDIARLEAAAGTAGRGVARKIDTGTRGFSRFSGAAKNADSKIRAFGRGTLYAAPIIGLLALGVKRATDEAINSENAELRLVQAYKKVGASRQQAIDDLAVLQRRQFTVAVSDEEMADAQAKLTQATGSRTLAMKGLSASLDLAAARNISLDSAQKAVGKALNGSTAGLARFGIMLDAGSNKTQVLTQLQERFGGAAEKQASGAAGAMKKLSLAVGETLEALGKGIIPLLKQMGEWLSKTQNQKKLQEQLKTITEDSVTVFQKVAGAVEFMSENWNALKNIVKLLASPFIALVKYNQWFIDHWPQVKSLGVSAANLIKAAWEKLQPVIDVVRSILGYVRDQFNRARRDGGAAANFISDRWNDLKSVFSAVKGFIESLVGAFKTVRRWGQTAANGIKSAFDGAASWFGGAFAAIGTVIDKLQAAYDLAKSIIGLGGHGEAPAANVQGTGRFGAVVTPATGGLITGGIPGRDSVPAMLTPGELVLNKQQQLALLRGGGGGSPVIHVYIGNEAVEPHLVRVVDQAFDQLGQYVATRPGR